MIFTFGGEDTNKAKKELYEALQYSDLVTEDMTFEEMCEVLATEYPEIHITWYKAYFYTNSSGTFCDLTVYNSDSSIAHQETLQTSASNYEDKNISIIYNTFSNGRWVFTYKVDGTVEVTGAKNNGTDYGGTANQILPYLSNEACTITFVLAE